MTNTLIARLRGMTAKLRTTSIPIADVAPSLREAADRIEALQSRLTALEGQEPLAWIVYAKDSRRYFTLTFDVNKVPEIYVGGEALPLFLAAGAAPTAGLPFVPWSKEAEMRESWVAPQQAEPKEQT